MSIAHHITPAKSSSQTPPSKSVAHRKSGPDLEAWEEQDELSLEPDEMSEEVTSSSNQAAIPEKPVTFRDYVARTLNGRGPETLDTEAAHAREAIYSRMTLDDWASQFTVKYQEGQPQIPVLKRTEEEMLAAVHAKTVPRYVARVGLKNSFEDFRTFGNSRKMFLFATEPCDLVGCQPLEAMVKVGWDKGSILHSAGEDIAVCILDTASFCQSDTSKVADSCQENESEDVTQAVGVGEVCWSDVISALKVSESFYEEVVRELTITGDSSPSKQEMIILLGHLGKLPIGHSPGPDFNQSWLFALRKVLGSQCSINSLYSGQGMTIRDNQDGNAYQIGAREVMVKHARTGIPLTEENAKVMTLGQYSNEEALCYFNSLSRQ